MADYPDDIFAQRTITNVPGQTYDASKQTRIYAEDLIKLGDEITAVETELGTDPKGSHTSVSARLDFIERGASVDTSVSEIIVDAGQYSMFILTAQDEDFTIDNPTGSPVDGQSLLFRIKDNGSPTSITFDTQYRGIITSLPTVTVASKTLYLGFKFNSADTKWDLLAVAQES